MSHSLGAYRFGQRRRAPLSCCVARTDASSGGHLGDIMALLNLALFVVRDDDQHTQVAACFLDFLPEGGFDSP